MKENAVKIWRASGTCRGIERTHGCSAQRYKMCEGMTTVVTGGMSFIAIRRMVRTGKSAMVICGFIKMAMECPHRPVSDGAK
jgi:hypothetical protein